MAYQCLSHSCLIASDERSVQIEKGVPPAVMDLIWLEILIAMIGEQFGEEMDYICGLVCNVRNKGSKVSKGI